MKSAIARLCASHGIEPSYQDADGAERPIAQETLRALADALGIHAPAPRRPAGIAEARAETASPLCHVPRGLRRARIWGVTCQLSSLASKRNLGIGDFADLAALCRTLAATGADFVGLNPLHALFWSDSARVSPFSPSNRSFLNPMYLALDWIEGFAGLTAEEERQAKRLRQPALIDALAVAALKGGILRRLFATFPWGRRSTSSFEKFCADRGEALLNHARFEALSAEMVSQGHGAGWLTWPEAYRDRRSAEAARLCTERDEAVRFHRWLQWQSDRQLARVQRGARQAGMRLGLYLDFAVGTAADGSATWTDPETIVPSLSIGAPPDSFSTRGQDWGLAPLSPLCLAERDGSPFAATLAASMRHAGALRIDHAMSLARLWLIPRGMPATAGAYVRYPLSTLLARMAEVSQENRTIVIGEDLGVVPRGFRLLMEERHFHAYRVFHFEFDAQTGCDTEDWPVDALACIATHDMPTFHAWWSGGDLRLRERLGMLTGTDLRHTRNERAAERRALRRLLDADAGPGLLSPKLHAFVAASPCRLFAMQIEDALGVAAQVNLPGTINQHPNWRRRLPVPVDQVADHPGFRAHVAAVSDMRPR